MFYKLFNSKFITSIEISTSPVELFSYSLFFDIDNARLVHEEELESLIKDFLQFYLNLIIIDCKGHINPSDHLTLYHIANGCNYNMLMSQHLIPSPRFKYIDLIDFSMQLTSILIDKIKEHYNINQKQFQVARYNILIKATAMKDTSVYN